MQMRPTNQRDGPGAVRQVRRQETGPQAVTPLQVAQPVVMMRKALNKPLFIVHFSLLYILPVSLSTDEDCPVFLLADIASQFYPAAA